MRGGFRFVDSMRYYIYYQEVAGTHLYMHGHTILRTLSSVSVIGCDTTTGTEHENVDALTARG